MKKDELSGKRLGYLKKNEGTHYRVDSLMHHAIRFLKDQGAEIIELDEIVDGTPYINSLEVMAFEFKDGLKNYFERLGKHSPVSDLADVIKLTRADSLEMLYFDLSDMEKAQAKGSLDSKEYKAAVKKMLKAYGADGIDRIMDQHHLMLS